MSKASMGVCDLSQYTLMKIDLCDVGAFCVHAHSPFGFFNPYSVQDTILLVVGGFRLNL